MSMPTAIPEREEAVIISGFRKGQIVKLDAPRLFEDWDDPEVIASAINQLADCLDRVDGKAAQLEEEIRASVAELRAAREARQ